MMPWLRKNIGVLAAVTAAVLWIVGTIVHAYLIRADVDFSIERVEHGQVELVEEDVRVNKRVTAIEAAQATQTVKLTRIETRQTGIVTTVDRMDSRLEKTNDKLDELLRR